MDHSLNSPPLVAVIDDDDGVRHSITNLLRSSGYACALYDSAEAFLAADAHHKIACAIIDLHLPGVSGLHLQYLLQSKHPTIRIILISSLLDEQSKTRALNHGALAVFQKAFDPAALLEALRFSAEGH